MPRNIPLNVRLAADSDATDEVVIVLAIITHPTLDAPVRLTSDPTERLSIDPLAYGTISEGETYLFVLMGAQLPDDAEDAPPATSLVFENVAADMVKPFREITSPCTVELRTVLASDPDTVVDVYSGLLGVAVRGNGDQVSLELNRDNIFARPWPAERMTANRFPGLHR